MEQKCISAAFVQPVNGLALLIATWFKLAYVVRWYFRWKWLAKKWNLKVDYIKYAISQKISSYTFCLEENHANVCNYSNLGLQYLSFKDKVPIRSIPSTIRRVSIEISLFVHCFIYSGSNHTSIALRNTRKIDFSIPR